MMAFLGISFFRSMEFQIGLRFVMNKKCVLWNVYLLDTERYKLLSLTYKLLTSNQPHISTT